MKKYRCVDEIYSNVIGRMIREGEVVEVIEFDTFYDLYSVTGEYIGILSDKSLIKHFKPYIEAECTVTKDKLRDLAEEYLDNKMKARELFKGWDIVRLITEGKLKEGTILVESENRERYLYKCKDILDSDGDSVAVYDLVTLKFEIEPFEKVSFKEAVENNYKIRHENWENGISYTTINNILNFYSKSSSKNILNDLLSDAKVWEVEPND